MWGGVDSLRGPRVASQQSCRTCLSEQLREVVDIGGAQGLGLEPLGLKQILGDIRGVDQHPVLGSLLVAKGVKHDLDRTEEKQSEGGDFQRSTVLSHLFLLSSVKMWWKEQSTSQRVTKCVPRRANHLFSATAGQPKQEGTVAGMGAKLQKCDYPSTLHTQTQPNVSAQKLVGSE